MRRPDAYAFKERKCEGPAQAWPLQRDTSCRPGLSRLPFSLPGSCEAAYQHVSRTQRSEQWRPQLRLQRHARSRVAIYGNAQPCEAGVAQGRLAAADQAGRTISGPEDMQPVRSHLVAYRRLQGRIWPLHAGREANQNTERALEGRPMKNNRPLSYLNRTAFISESEGSFPLSYLNRTASIIESVSTERRRLPLSFLNAFIYLPRAGSFEHG